MKFDEAVVMLNGSKELISLEDIPRRKNFLEIIQNIYCPDPNCKARLVFNRKSTGKNYLSKHRADEHDTDCVFYEDRIKPVKSITEYTEVNGGLTDKGKNRRKKEAMKALRDYLDPPKPKPKDPNRKPTPRRKTTESTGTQQGIKVNYDPNGEVIQQNSDNGDIKVKEPPFYERLPHQLSVKDSGENLRTSAIIKEVAIFETNGPRAEIKTSFEDIKITFAMPEAFFVANERRLQTNQLIEYLSIIKKYVEKNSDYLFLTTMC